MGVWFVTADEASLRARRDNLKEINGVGPTRRSRNSAPKTRPETATEEDLHDQENYQANAGLRSRPGKISVDVEGIGRTKPTKRAPRKNASPPAELVKANESPPLRVRTSNRSDGGGDVGVEDPPEQPQLRAELGRRSPTITTPTIRKSGRRSRPPRKFSPSCEQRTADGRTSRSHVDPWPEEEPPPEEQEPQSGHEPPSDLEIEQTIHRQMVVPAIKIEEAPDDGSRGMRGRRRGKERQVSSPNTLQIPVPPKRTRRPKKAVQAEVKDDQKTIEKEPGPSSNGELLYSYKIFF